MKTFRSAWPWTATAAVALILAAAVAPPARADTPLINNGSFEAGFASWTRQDSAGSDGSFLLQSGTTSTVNGNTVPAPPSGTHAAMTDALGPGSHVLFQDFVVPVGVSSATLQFSLFVGNQAVDPSAPVGPLFANPSTLDWTTPTLNQQARVDILGAASDPFSLASTDVLQNLFQTAPGSTFGPGYASFTMNLTSLLASHGGQTLRLRFAEADNIALFQFGVDGVSLNAASVPEPSSLALSGLGALLGLVVSRRRSARAV